MSSTFFHYPETFSFPLRISKSAFLSLKSCLILHRIRLLFSYILQLTHKIIPTSSITKTYTYGRMLASIKVFPLLNFPYKYFPFLIKNAWMFHPSQFWAPTFPKFTHSNLICTVLLIVLYIQENSRLELHSSKLTQLYHRNTLKVYSRYFLIYSWYLFIVIARL